MKNLITNFVINENGLTSTKAAVIVAVALMATQTFAGSKFKTNGLCKITQTCKLHQKLL